MKPAHRQLPAALVGLCLLAGSAHAQTVNLSVWDLPAQTTAGVFSTLVAPTVADGVTASAIQLLDRGDAATTGISGVGTSPDWRFGRWTGGGATNAYFGFSVTADAETTLVLSELLFSARLVTTTSASWTNATLALSYSQQADFSSGTVAAGALAFADIGASTTGATTDSLAGTYFDTPLTINPGETYYFKLRPSGFSGSNARLHLLSNADLSGNDFLIRGTVSAVPEPSSWAAIAGAGGLVFAMSQRRRRRS